METAAGIPPAAARKLCALVTTCRCSGRFPVRSVPARTRRLPAAEHNRGTFQDFFRYLVIAPRKFAVLELVELEYFSFDVRTADAVPAKCIPDKLID